MRNSLQDQLLRSGLVDAKKIKEANRALSKQKKQAGKNASELAEEQRLARETLEAKARSDRELAEQQNAAARQHELRAQIAQLVAHYRQPRDGGDISYNFADRGVIKKILVSARLRDQLIRGQLAIVRSAQLYELVPAAAAERIRSRDADVIVTWNEASKEQLAEDDPYKDFPIPDDLMW